MSKRNKENRKKMGKKAKVIIGLIVALILAAGGFVVYKVVFKGEEIKLPTTVTTPTPEVKKLTIIDEESNSRPYAVMLENHPDSRPYHSGFQDAYVVYEIVVEGGITRFMAVFKDKIPETVAAIRSARHYYLDYALEHDAIYVHWGYSPQAISDIRTLGVTALNENHGSAFSRFTTAQAPVSSEHRAYVNLKKLDEYAESKSAIRTTSDAKLVLNYNVEEINLNDKDKAITANKVVVPYSGSYVSSYEYDSEAKVYKRFINGAIHKDFITGNQYTFKNIIAYDVANSLISGDTKNRQNIDNIGTGTGYYITNGYAVPITWSKASRSAQTIYKYEDGTEIDVNDGNTFIQIYPTRQVLTIN